MEQNTDRTRDTDLHSTKKINMCLYPKRIKNPKYKRNKKNGGQVPPLTDPRLAYVMVGCGVCMECTRQRTESWRARLLEDIKHNQNARFITLTFSNENYTALYKELEGTGYIGYEMDNQIAKLAVKRFINRHIKRHKKSIRHWLVTELGHTGTEHLHLHGLLYTDLTTQEIEIIWQYGFIWDGYQNKAKYVNERTVNYICKYVHKQDLDHPHYKPIILTSPGIGRDYTQQHNFKNLKYIGEETEVAYTTSTGHKIGLPLYWKQKAFTDDEREKLWIHKLDKGILYVNKQKIDIHNRPQDYEKALIAAQRKNTELGYQTPVRDKDKIAKEIKHRIKKQKERMYNNNKKKNKKQNK